MRSWFKALLITLAILTSCGVRIASAATDEFLEPEKAFVFSAQQLNNKTLEVNFKIAPGYYLYREQISAKTDNPRVQLGIPQLPKGIVKFDETFQKELETYRNELSFQVPILAGEESFTLQVTSQGCADAGLCYPPMQSEQRFELSSLLTSSTAFNSSAQSFPSNPSRSMANTDPDGKPLAVESILKNRALLTGVFVFFGIGLLLTFTPCVLPMIPILSSIIVGEGQQLTRMRGFVLSAVYVLGMAIIYTAVGVAAGLAGQGLTAALQNPWVLSLFAALLVALSLSMFGFYELQLPAVIRDKLTAVSSKQKGGKVLGVFLMGALSALIVGPCVTAPLAATLAFIAQTRDAVFGGVILFAMALGMGVPLLVVGMGAGSFLPRVGSWMQAVKQFFGVLLLGTALWMLSPVIPVWVQMLAWAILLLVSASYLRVLDPLPSQMSSWVYLWKGIGIVCLIWGSLLLIGLSLGGRDLLQPLAPLRIQSAASSISTAQPPIAFARVNSIEELDQRLKNLNGKLALLDFYADWCVSCKEMEKFTFTDPQVASKMAEFVLLQVDVTANNNKDKDLMKRFNLFGPPGIIFFDEKGQEIPGTRVIGFQGPEKFLDSLRRISH
ncbi:MAG: protein-disulfide reductase DsbD [Burkholderiaceae bacterium]|nr:protein-disulfide reductase DsbD [Burkholderiaceae bacterium]